MEELQVTTPIPFSEPDLSPGDQFLLTTISVDHHGPFEHWVARLTLRRIVKVSLNEPITTKGDDSVSDKTDAGGQGSLPTDRSVLEGTEPGDAPSTATTPFQDGSDCKDADSDPESMCNDHHQSGILRQQAEDGRSSMAPRVRLGDRQDHQDGLLRLELPEGWRLKCKEVRAARPGEHFFVTETGNVHPVMDEMIPDTLARIIVEKIWEWSVWLKAAWIAKDEDGKWYGYTSCPKLGCSLWKTTLEEGNIPLNASFIDWTDPPWDIDWKDSLTRNPDL